MVIAPTPCRFRRSVVIVRETWGRLSAARPRAASVVGCQ